MSCALGVAPAAASTAWQANVAGGQYRQASCLGIRDLGVRADQAWNGYGYGQADTDGYALCGEGLAFVSGAPGFAGGIQPLRGGWAQGPDAFPTQCQRQPWRTHTPPTRA